MSDDELQTIDENARRKFEQALIRDHNVELSDYLPHAASPLFAATLEELVLIDLEFRWRDHPQVPAVPIERYIERYSILNDNDRLKRLIAEEFRLRMKRGELPSIVEYQQRFPQLELDDTFSSAAAGETHLSGSQLVNTPRAPSLAHDRYGGRRQFASGGMGVVFTAQDLTLEREIAIKELKADYANHLEAKTRFLNEAKLTARLQHPGVVPVYDLGSNEKNLPYYAMKRVEGETLRDQIADHVQNAKDQSSQRRLLTVLISVARTVAFAHDRGVIHRDLKPANIVVGKYGETVVLDWGLAKEVDAHADPLRDESPNRTTADTSTGFDSELTAAGSILGTPAYMAPEQARTGERPLDGRADIYGLGAILYHILTGQPSIHSLHELQERLSYRRELRPRMINHAIPRPLDAICAKAMAFEPEARYETASEFADELERFLADEPVHAYHDPVHVRLGRWARRHKTWVTTGIAVGLLLMISGVSSAFLIQSAMADREREVATRRTSIEQSEATARAEIFAGRFNNGRVHLEKAIELCGDDATFATRRHELESELAEVDQLLSFERLVARAERVGWNDQDEDAVLLLQRGLAQVHVFEHWDWWEHITPLELSPEIEEDLRQTIYRELCLLVAMRLHWGMLSFDNLLEFSQGTNAEARQIFTHALVPIQAARRYRPALGLEFANALCEAQAAESISLAKLSAVAFKYLGQINDPKMLRNPVDQYFIGICMLYYHLFKGDDPIVDLAGFYLKFDDPLAMSLTLLRDSSAAQPDRLFTVFSYAWAAEAAEDYDRAISAFSRCIVIAPDDYEAYNERALQYLMLGINSREEKPVEANEHFRRALADLEYASSLAPANEYVLWRKAVVLAYLPNTAPSVIATHLKGTKLTAPDDSRLQFEYHRAARKSNLEPILDYVKQTIDVLPELDEAYALGALVAWRLDLRDEAEKYLAIARDRWSDSPTVHIIDGEMALADQAYSRARLHFRSALEKDDSDFLAWRGLAWASLHDGNTAEAYQTFDELVAQAQNEWQSFDALEGRILSAIQLGAEDQVAADVDRLLDLRPSAPLETIVHKLETAQSNELLKKVKQQLQDRSPIPTPPLLTEPGSTALLNGGFELSLNHYWETSDDRPSVWWNEGSCRAIAERVRQAPNSGDFCLRIRNLSKFQDGVFGSMRQEIPIPHSGKYKLQVASKSQNLTQNGVVIRVLDEDGDLIGSLALPPADQDWQRSVAEFQVSAPFVTVEIRSQDEGTVWIDDLQLIAM